MSNDTRLTRGSTAKRASTMLSAVVFFCLTACSAQDGKNNALDDVNGLRNLVDIPFPLASARWEVFATPEYDGGVPGRTDYMTLVAEIEPLQKAAYFTSGANDKTVYIVPEAARPWISNAFRNILEMHKNANLDLATTPGCHAYGTKVKKSGRSITGFTCIKSGRVLLYLALLDDVQA